MKICRRWGNKFRGNNRGLTLIEAMIGILIFTVGALSVCTMVIRAHESYIGSRRSTSEVNATALNIEALKHSGYENKNVLQDDDEKGGTDPYEAPGNKAYITYRVGDNAVVSGTKLINMSNNRVSDNANVPAFTLLFTKPEIR